MPTAGEYKHEPSGVPCHCFVRRRIRQTGCGKSCLLQPHPDRTHKFKKVTFNPILSVYNYDGDANSNAKQLCIQLEQTRPPVPHARSKSPPPSTTGAEALRDNITSFFGTRGKAKKSNSKLPISCKYKDVNNNDVTLVDVKSSNPHPEPQPFSHFYQRGSSNLQNDSLDFSDPDSSLMSSSSLESNVSSSFENDNPSPLQSSQLYTRSPSPPLNSNPSSSSQTFPEHESCQADDSNLDSSSLSSENEDQYPMPKRMSTVQMGDTSYCDVCQTEQPNCSFEIGGSEHEARYASKPVRVADPGKLPPTISNSGESSLKSDEHIYSRMGNHPRVDYDYVAVRSNGRRQTESEKLDSSSSSPAFSSYSMVLAKHKTEVDSSRLALETIHHGPLSTPNLQSIVASPYNMKFLQEHTKPNLQRSCEQTSPLKETNGDTSLDEPAKVSAIYLLRMTSIVLFWTGSAFLITLMYVFMFMCLQEQE